MHPRRIRLFTTSLACGLAQALFGAPSLNAAETAASKDTPPPEHASLETQPLVDTSAAEGKAEAPPDAKAEPGPSPAAAQDTHAPAAAPLPAKQAAPGTDPAGPEPHGPAPGHAVEPNAKDQDHSATVEKPHPATKAADPHAPGAKAETADAHAASAHAKPAEAGEDAHGENKGVPEEIMSLQSAELMKYSDKAYEDGRYDTALIGYRQLLTHKMPKAKIRAALLGFGRTLKKQGELTKAVAVFERLIKDFPAEADTPEIYLDLGRCQRALGAYKTAITRFYSVINSTIKLTEDGAARYRQLAKTAQFEIAETYFMSGDYKEAMRFYSRLRLLDLHPTDRARAHFKAAYSQQLAGDNIGAITQLRSFIELNPDDENVPEARYIIADALRKLGRSQDALFEALELLRTERTRTAQDPKRWAYWQRKTGNQIANEFYNQGDTSSALMIYLSLLELSSEDGWRAPILYQIALCQERQGRKDKAIENYKTILDIAAAHKGDDPRKVELADLARMSTWRLSQIEWVHNAEQRLNSLLPNIDPEAQPSANAPATK